MQAMPFLGRGSEGNRGTDFYPLESRRRSTKTWDWHWETRNPSRTKLGSLLSGLSCVSCMMSWCWMMFEWLCLLFVGGNMRIPTV